MLAVNNEMMVRDRADEQPERLLFLAQSLETISQGLSAFCAPLSGQSMRGAGEQTLGALARQLYRDRRLRSSIFEDSDLFGEPAWDMLLDLFIAEDSGKQVSITSACIGSDVPNTTALRWLSILERKELVARKVDGLDARRAFVALTDKGRSIMIDYLSRIQRGR